MLQIRSHRWTTSITASYATTTTSIRVRILLGVAATTVFEVAAVMAIILRHSHGASSESCHC